MLLRHTRVLEGLSPVIPLPKMLVAASGIVPGSTIICGFEVGQGVVDPDSIFDSRVVIGFSYRWEFDFDPSLVRRNFIFRAIHENWKFWEVDGIWNMSHRNNTMHITVVQQPEPGLGLSPVADPIHIGPDDGSIPF